MAVTPAGSLSVPAAKLRRMLSLSTTFQNTVANSHGGPATAASALDHILLRRPEPNRSRPYAIITIGDQHRYGLVAGGVANHLRVWGGLFVVMTIPTPQQYYDDPVQADFFAANFFGQVMDEVHALSGQDDTGSSDGIGHLGIVRTDLIPNSLGENDPSCWETEGRCYWAMYSVHWGDDDRNTRGY